MELATEPGIVVGCDGSPDADAALCWAVDEARLRRARLRIVCAWEPPIVEYPYSGLAYEPEYVEAAVQAIADAAVTSARAHAADIEIDQRVACGTPAAVLLAESQDADLLVVGSRGLGGFRGLLLGSVSTKVTHHAACPVVVVRPTREGVRHDT